MDVARFRMLIHEFFNNYPDIVPEEASVIILDSKSSMYMAKTGKGNKHTKTLQGE